MTETRDFSTAAIASLSTGVLLSAFSEVHEAAEYLMGHPIYTHQFKRFKKEVQRTILEQCPGMPTILEGVTKDNYQERLAEIESDIGKTVRIRKGSRLTAMLPEDGIPEEKLVKVFVETR